MQNVILNSPYSSVGFLVNGRLVAKKQKEGSVGGVQTYLDHIGVEHQAVGLRLEVTPQDVTLTLAGQRDRRPWSEHAALRGPR